MCKFYALLTYRAECVGGIHILQGTPQDIAESIMYTLEIYVNEEILDDDYIKYVNQFIDKTNNKSITFNDIENYSCYTNNGSEEVVVIGNDSSIILKIAEELFR